MAFFSRWFRPKLYKEQRTGIEFPSRLGDYKRGKVKCYEAEANADGMMVEYRSKDAEVTVFVRALEDENNKTSAEFLNESLACIKDLEAQGKENYSNIKFYAFCPDKERPGWNSAAFTSNSANHFIVSFIYCKVASGNLVKIRATTPNTKNELLQSFIKNIQECVDNAPIKA